MPLFTVFQSIQLPGDTQLAHFEFVVPASTRLEALAIIEANEDLPGATYRVEDYGGAYVSKGLVSSARARQLNLKKKHLTQAKG